MLHGINLKELEDHLEKIFDKLVEKKILPAVSTTEKKELIAQIATTLKDDPKATINKDTLADGKALTAACILVASDKKDASFKLLFKDDLVNSIELHLLLKKVFKTLLDEKAKNNPEQRKQLDNMLDDLAKTLERHLHKEDFKSVVLELSIADKLIEEQQRQQRIADYGVDTHKTGAVVGVILAAVFGNQAARADYATFGDNAMAKANAADTGIPDPLGVKTQAVVNSLADGVINSNSELDMLNTLKETLGIPLAGQAPRPRP